MILDIQYYASKSPRKEFVKLVIGEKGVETKVLATGLPSGVCYIWGYYCKAISGKLDVTLQVVCNDKVYDELYIGVLSSTGVSLCIVPLHRVLTKGRQQKRLLWLRKQLGRDAAPV